MSEDPGRDSRNSTNAHSSVTARCRQQQSGITSPTSLVGRAHAESLGRPMITTTKAQCRRDRPRKSAVPLVKAGDTSTMAIPFTGGNRAVRRATGSKPDRPQKPRKNGISSPLIRGREREGEHRLEVSSDVELNGKEELGTIQPAGGCAGPHDWAYLVQQLRDALDEVAGLRRDVAAAAHERQARQQREDDLCLTVSRLEYRCGALERSLRAETDAANTEQAKAAKVEENFERLLAWAREEERRRCEADNNYSRARERTAAATARITVVEEEARAVRDQHDARRLQLESALEDLRKRTLDNERLAEQVKGMNGEVAALRELADGRGLENVELRNKLSRVVKEAKDMASENVHMRKHLSAEQERWRSVERARVKQEDRRRTELDRKSDDIDALRYRVQELEARLTSETTRRQGAEEDSRRSQEMHRRSVEELLENRKASRPVQTGFGLRYPPSNHHNSETLFCDATFATVEPTYRSVGAGINSAGVPSVRNGIPRLWTSQDGLMDISSAQLGDGDLIVGGDRQNYGEVSSRRAGGDAESTAWGSRDVSCPPTPPSRRFVRPYTTIGAYRNGTSTPQPTPAVVVSPRSRPLMHGSGGPERIEPVVSSSGDVCRSTFSGRRRLQGPGPRVRPPAVEPSFDLRDDHKRGSSGNWPRPRPRQPPTDCYETAGNDQAQRNNDRNERNDERVETCSSHSGNDHRDDATNANLSDPKISTGGFEEGIRGNNRPVEDAGRLHWWGEDDGLSDSAMDDPGDCCRGNVGGARESSLKYYLEAEVLL